MDITENDVLEWDLKQRAFDGKWELIGKVVDTENIYRYTDMDGIVRVLIPFKWITFKVYDYLLTIEEWCNNNG